MNRMRTLAALFLLVGGVVARADDWTTGSYTYNDAGEITAIGTDTFAYDLAGRLLSGTAGTGRKQQYSFDDFGNIVTIVTTDTNNTPKNFLAVDPGTNRLVDSGEAYDQTVADAQAAGGVVLFGEHDDRGNVISTNGMEFFTYDALNVMTTSITGGVETFHVYGADDERAGSITVNGPAAGTAKWTFRDLDGKVLRTVFEAADGTFSWDADYLYRGDALLSAAVPTRYKVLQYHLDHLGTPRLVTANGGVELARYTYYPFGKDVPEQPAIDTGDLKFTGHERDTATRDYMHARYYSAVAGRFLSADPGADWDRRMPASWNLFGYVRNTPMNAIDPDGRQIVITAPRADPLPGPSASIGFFLSGNSVTQQLDRLAAAKNPVTGMTVREHMNANLQGLAAFADGLNPLGDPMSSAYGDGAVEGTEYSYWTGFATFQLEALIVGTYGGAPTGNITTVSRWGKEGLQAGDWVMVGRANVRNWLFSGKAQWWGSNQAAPLATGQAYRVASSALRMPNERSLVVNLVKAWIGQRIYLP